MGSVNEAQKLGAAVIAPGYGGSSELTDNEWQIKDTSVEALKVAIEHALDGDNLNRMRADSLKRSGEYMNLEEYAGKIVKFYSLQQKAE